MEHDLVLSRALCELYSDPILQDTLVFRGGTALHKLYFDKAHRFSDDLDFVQANAGAIGDLITQIRNKMDPWLGKPHYKQGHGRFTLYYRFETEFEPKAKRKVKIEINTREHFTTHGYVKKIFSMDSRWFSGQAPILTYSLEELMGTKLRAISHPRRAKSL